MERAPRPCPFPGCDQLTTATACPAHRRDGRAGAYGGLWRKISPDWLRHHPRCVECGGRATQVHHATMIKAGGARLNPGNYRSVCAPCHAKITARETRPAQPRRIR